MKRIDIVKRLKSRAAHDGKTEPSGGEPPTAADRDLLLDAAEEIQYLRREVRRYQELGVLTGPVLD